MEHLTASRALGAEPFAAGRVRGTAHEGDASRSWRGAWQGPSKPGAYCQQRGNGPSCLPYLARSVTGVQVTAEVCAVIRSMSSFQASTKDLAPLLCSLAATFNQIDIGLRKRPRITLASPPSAGSGSPDLAVIEEGLEGDVRHGADRERAASPCTYRVSGEAGSLMLVLAHSNRCVRVLAFSSRWNRSELMSCRYAR